MLLCDGCDCGIFASQLEKYLRLTLLSQDSTSFVLTLLWPPFQRGSGFVTSVFLALVVILALMRERNTVYRVSRREILSSAEGGGPLILHRLHRPRISMTLR